MGHPPDDIYCSRCKGVHGCYERCPAYTKEVEELENKELENKEEKVEKDVK